MMTNWMLLATTPGRPRAVNTLFGGHAYWALSAVDRDRSSPDHDTERSPLGNTSAAASSNITSCTIDRDSIALEVNPTIYIGESQQQQTVSPPPRAKNRHQDRQKHRRTLRDGITVPQRLGCCDSTASTVASTSQRLHATLSKGDCHYYFSVANGREQRLNTDTLTLP